MAEQLKISIPNEVCLTTIRTQKSKLWFVNNKAFEEELLGYLAKYQQDYGVIIYAFILMGNHYHMIAKFPKGNRHKFKQAFNRIFSNLLKRHTRSYTGGNVWARRYRPQALLEQKDILHWFFYSVLNPISSGLVQSIDDYFNFNSFSMSLTGEIKTYMLIDWRDYKNRKRYNRKLKPEDCSKEYKLEFSRLPGYEDQTQDEYKAFLLEECTKRTNEKIQARIDNKQGFLRKDKLHKIKAGISPKHTKTSNRQTHRPLALSLNSRAITEYLEGYFNTCRSYQQASHLYRKGFLNTRFPTGTFRPPMLLEHRNF